jgi:hypothetical protein
MNFNSISMFFLCASLSWGKTERVEGMLAGAGQRNGVFRRRHYEFFFQSSFVLYVPFALLVLTRNDRTA